MLRWILCILVVLWINTGIINAIIGFIISSVVVLYHRVCYICHWKNTESINMNIESINGKEYSSKKNARVV